MNKSIPFYWKKSINALASAKSLYVQGFYDDSISRAYYTILNSARAVLLVHGIITKSHTAVQRCFGINLVQTGELGKECSVVLTQEHTLRTSADYEEQFFASGEMAEEMVQSAERFVLRMKAYLEKNGIFI